MAKTFRSKVVCVGPVTFQEVVGFESDVAFDEDVCIEGDLRVVSGELSLGDLRTSDPAVLELKGGSGGKNKPAAIALYDHDGDPHYLWVDSSGQLRVGDDYPENEKDGNALVTGTPWESGGKTKSGKAKSRKTE